MSTASKPATPTIKAMCCHTSTFAHLDWMQNNDPCWWRPILTSCCRRVVLSIHTITKHKVAYVLSYLRIYNAHIRWNRQKVASAAAQKPSRSIAQREKWILLVNQKSITQSALSRSDSRQWNFVVVNPKRAPKFTKVVRFTDRKLVPFGPSRFRCWDPVNQLHIAHFRSGPWLTVVQESWPLA